MRVALSTKGPTILEADVRAFEARIGRQLPSDYRRFLLIYNGGRLAFHVIRNRASGDIGVKLFFGIWPKTYYDIDIEYRNMAGRWPSRFLSIAIDDCGKHFLISLDPAELGAIDFWDHEQEAEEGEEPREDNHVADSFDEFCERMEPIDMDAYLSEKQAEMPPREARPMNGDAT